MGNADAAAGPILVELVHAPAPHRLLRLVLSLPAGATVADALLASGWGAQLGAAVIEGLRAGIWGRACTPQTPLRMHDRIELYRPLQVDPKEARRQRYRRDGVRRAPR